MKKCVRRTVIFLFLIGLFYIFTNKLINQNLDIRKKVFIIVSDSGANVKKAFIDTKSADNDRIDYAEIVTSFLEKVNIEEGGVAERTEERTIDASESKTDSDWCLN
jgi:hypothetical protein